MLLDADTGRALKLTRRQNEVLHLLSKGLRNSEIASQLGVTERTVKYHVSQLLLTFDTTNRTELVGLFASGNIPLQPTRRWVP